MGRLTKQGIDYFPLDCEFDDKTELYILEKEAVGLAVMLTLWQLIYRDEGYFIAHDDDLALLVKRRINVDRETVESCIHAMLRRSIFDQDLHDKYGILTSKAIQKRFLIVTRKRKVAIFIEEYILINDISSAGNIKISGRNAVYSGKNTTKESKGKESKGDISSDEDISEPEGLPLRPGPPPNSPPKCPQQKIIDLYHKLLPELPVVRVWNEYSAGNLRTRWAEDRHRQSLEWWENFFRQIIRTSDFLMGRKKDWRASLGWMVGPKNFAKIANGEYHSNGDRKISGIAEWLRRQQEGGDDCEQEKR